MRRTNVWKLGLFVVLAVVVGVAGVFYLGFSRYRREAVSAVTYFDESVQGLDVGSPVKFRGVTLGTVSSITIAPDQRHVEVWMQVFEEDVERLGLEVSPGRGTNPSLRTQLASSGLTGVKFLQVDFFPIERHPLPPLPFAPGQPYLPSVPSTLRSVEQLLTQFLDELPAYGDRVTAVLEEARRTLATVRELGSWIRDSDGAVQTLVRRLDEAVTAFDRAIADARVGETTAALRTASAGVSAASGQVQAVTDQLDASLRGLREALEAVRALARSLERDPGAILRRGPATEGPPERDR